MPLSELTDQNAMLSAMREYDALGPEAFLTKYGYAPARRYHLVHNGRKYDSKAIAGAAYGFQFPDRGPLRSDEFSGGEATVRPILESLGFKIDSSGEGGQQSATPKITYEDIHLIRRSRGKDRYNDLSAEERAAYQRIHDSLTLLGGVALRVLEGVGQFSVTLTSQFYPQSGVRGAIPKDLWFAVSNDLNRETFVGMPQLFMIVSERGIEYGFAASIHPSDFSSPPFQQRVRNAAPRIFAALPSPGSPAGIALKASVDQSGKWFFRRKTRLDPNVKEYSSLDEWLSFLKSPAGTKSAGGSISRYLTDDDLKRSDLDLESLVREAAEIFSPLMQTVTPVALEGKPEISVRDAIDEFLSKFLSFRTTISFGQHEELKILLNQLRAGLEEFSSLRAHPHVRVSWSLGAGNWARIPWIAFMDERETTSTQRGVYCVMLFPEDMSGVYLTLAQGVTDTIEEHGRPEGRRMLHTQAIAIREMIGTELNSRFALDDNIDLHTEGALGQDYEAGAIAYRFYAKREIPPDTQINDDFRILLGAYEQVLRRRATRPGSIHASWIFQANPKIFDIDGALKQLPELTWTVKDQTEKNAAVGDKVFLWKAGSEAGVVALATIITTAVRQPMPSEEQPFVLNSEKLGDIQPRVKLRIDRVLSEPLLRTTIAADARLNDLMILRFANYGTFKLSQHHAEALMLLIDDVDQTTSQTKSEHEHRVWLYAPGENAEHWAEFYENGIMAIGWDSLGDLSEFGSIDDVLAAMQRVYQADARPTNNARACYDFAHTARSGDRVFVKRGRHTIIGHGVITGEYEYRPDREQFTNIRKVRWQGRGSWPSPAPVAIKTLTDITEDSEFVSALEKLIALSGLEPAKSVPPAIRKPYTIEQALDGLFMEEGLFRRALSIWREKKNLILQGSPGVGKSFVARRLAYALMGFHDPSRVQPVQFHQSYSYEDFIQGYRPAKGGLSLQPGVFLEFCERAREDANEIYVVIIDEINRGNLSKIFGELMLLIEPDKRSSDWATKLAYAQSAEDRFYVPSNIYLLGMMNTADRSLSFVDYALRRRFAFVTLRPEYQSARFHQQLIAKGASPEIVDRIVARMTALNEEIASDKTNLGPGYCVGHSFFVPSESNRTPDEPWYRHVIETEIFPLLEEYWFESPARAVEWRERLLSE